MPGHSRLPKADCAVAVREFDEAREWLGRVDWRLMPPLAVEVWLFDLEEGWQSLFVDDRRRIRWHAGWLADLTST